MSNPVGKPLTETDLRHILDGACILGCGGGGPYELGKTLLEQVIKKGVVYLADPGDVPDSAWMAVSAGVGSPLAAAQGFPFDVATIAFQQLEKLLAKQQPAPLSFVLPGETGAGNSIVPMTVAVSRNLPLVDADGARRAIPLLETDTYAAQHIPISPVVLANATQTVSFDAPSPGVAQTVMDGIIDGGAFHEDAGIAFWAMNGATMKKAVVKNSVSFARELGQTLAAGRLKGNPVQAVTNKLGGEVLFRGTIDVTGVQQQTRGGFDFGAIPIKSKTGRVTIYTQNENLICWSEKSAQPLIMAPDLICYLTVEGQPFTNADLDLAKGHEIVVIGASCVPEMRLPYIVKSFLGLLGQLGYAGPYVPFEARPPKVKAGK